MSETKSIIVLGMGRSATSLVAGGLHHMIGMGDDLIPASRSNRWGHFEDKRFVALNDRILRSAGGLWNNPPPENSILKQWDNFSDEIAALCKEASFKKDVWGMKDPRMTLTIKLYLPFLSRPHFVCCFREPMEVAQSLFIRDGTPIQRGLDIAEIYNSRLLKFMSEFTGSGEFIPRG